MTDFQQELREVLQHNISLAIMAKDAKASMAQKLVHRTTEAITKLIEDKVIGEDFPVDTVAVSFPELVEHTAQNNLKAKQRAIVRGQSDV